MHNLCNCARSETVPARLDNRGNHRQEIMNRLLCVLLLAISLLLSSVSGVAAALGETESAITFRGEMRRIALPPIPVFVATARENPLPAAEAGRVLEPVLRGVATQVAASGGAALTLAVEKAGTDTAVRLYSKGRALPGAAYVLPADADRLRRAVAGHARHAGLRSLKGEGEFPGLQWNIRIHRPSSAAAAGAVKIDDAFWEPVEDMAVGGHGGSKRYDKSALLTFSFANTSKENLYVYVVNYTDDGQVLPVLPPRAKPDLPNLAAYGQGLTHPALSLELGAPVERVRLIVSRVPLAVAHWAQDSFDADPAEFERKGPPLSPEDWASREVVFFRK